MHNNEIGPFLIRIATTLYYSIWAMAVGGGRGEGGERAGGFSSYRKLLNSQISISTNELLYVIWSWFLICWFVFMTMIMFQWNNSWRRRTVREDIIEPCVNFFLIILCIRGRQKEKYLSLPLYCDFNTDMCLPLQTPRVFHCLACFKHVPGAGSNAHTIN